MPRFDLGLVHYHFVFLALCISKCIITWIDFLNPPPPPTPPKHNGHLLHRSSHTRPHSAPSWNKSDTFLPVLLGIPFVALVLPHASLQSESPVCETWISCLDLFGCFNAKDRSRCSRSTGMLVSRGHGGAGSQSSTQISSLPETHRDPPLSRLHS